VLASHPRARTTANLFLWPRLTILTEFIKISVAFCLICLVSSIDQQKSDSAKFKFCPSGDFVEHAHIKTEQNIGTGGRQRACQSRCRQRRRHMCPSQSRMFSQRRTTDSGEKLAQKWAYRKNCYRS
jgi:hypothetical protein